jgi:sarcosine oxidase, subunit beta
MFDVGVIGAGIHGASAAFHLADRGLRVVVFERGAPAGGPTGRSSAICRAYYTNAFLAGCARDSIDMFRRFSEITGEESGFRHTGLLFLHPPEDAARVEENARQLNGLGVEVDVLDTEEIARRHPSFDLDGIAVGAWERNAGYADPALATGGLFKRALELGAEHRLGRAVTHIEAGGDGGAIVATDDGERVSCRRLLVAAGPWTRPLLQQVGVDLPLTVERHIVGTYRWEEATPQPGHGDLIGGYYFRPEGEELFLVGPLHAAPNVDPDNFDERVAERELDDLAQPVIRRIPELERSSIHGGWASLYDVSPDWQPVIGEVAPGIFVDAGTSGHGFKLAPALGRHVAGLVAGDEVDPGIMEFHPSRFDEGRDVSAGWGEARILG